MCMCAVVYRVSYPIHIYYDCIYLVYVTRVVYRDRWKDLPGGLLSIWDVYYLLTCTCMMHMYLWIWVDTSIYTAPYMCYYDNDCHVMNHVSEILHIQYSSYSMVIMITICMELYVVVCMLMLYVLEALCSCWVDISSISKMCARHHLYVLGVKLLKNSRCIRLYMRGFARFRYCIP